MITARDSRAVILPVCVRTYAFAAFACCLRTHQPATAFSCNRCTFSRLSFGPLCTGYSCALSLTEHTFKQLLLWVPVDLLKILNSVRLLTDLHGKKQR